MPAQDNGLHEAVNADETEEQVKNITEDTTSHLESLNEEAVVTTSPFHAEEPKEELFETYYHYTDVDKPMPDTPGDQFDYIINWMGEDDPDKPLNWKMSLRVYMVCVCALDALTNVFGSAVIGPGNPQIMNLWHVGIPVAALNISLYVLGFAIGPMAWGPASEVFGRKSPICIGLLGQICFAFACGSAANFQTLVICRFFAGVFGAAPMTLTLAAMSDLFDNTQRGVAVSVVSLMIFAGPMMAPVVGGYISASFLGWRWTQYIWGILASLSLAISLVTPETYPPKVLSFRATKIRHKTGNWAIRSPYEIGEMSPRELLNRTILKPARMLGTEPILSLISIYHGFIYGILYLCLEAVPMIFEGHYNWHGGNVYLPYLGMMVGAILCTATMIWIFEPPFLRKLAASPYPVIPEERLPIMMMCGIIFAMGIFLMTWSAAYHAMWFVPVLGTAILGYGLVGIFLGAFNYIIDTYVVLSGSALAANTAVRSAFGCAFPLFVHPLFKNLGTQWAGTLLGCLASLMVPVPFCFFFFGKKIRAKSSFAASYETAIEKQISHQSSHRNTSVANYSTS